MTCKYCNNGELARLFVPFKNPNYKSIKDAKYLFHIKLVCEICEKFNGFEPQTDVLMEELKGKVFNKKI